MKLKEIIKIKIQPYLLGAVTVFILVLYTITTVVQTLDKKNQQLQTLQIKVEEYETAKKLEEEEKEKERTAPYEISYQNSYSDLYVDPPKEKNAPAQTVYLTFDDGPSQRTREILDVLDQFQIKATFFVTVQNEKTDTKEIMKMIVDRGHTIGVHTYSHNYREIYASVDNFLEDFYKIFQYIYEATGVKANIFRFPGGSINSFNQHTSNEIISEMGRRGFIHYDWNASSDDAVSKPSSSQIYENSLRNIDGLERVILLFHDSLDRRTTVEALPSIITELKNRGYQFAPITNDVKSITLSYRK